MTDNAVSGFSHLPWKPELSFFFFFHNCASHSDLDICRPWILIYFFQKVCFFCGGLGVTGVWGSSVWYVWMAWLKNSREGLSRYYSPVFVEFVFPVCQFASFFDASSKFSTRSGGQNVVKHHTWKTQFFVMCSNVEVKANSSLMIDQKTNHVWWSLSHVWQLRHCSLIVLMTSTWNIIVLFLNVLCLWSLVFKSFGKKGRKINVMILIHLIFYSVLKYEIRTVG